MNWKKHLKHLVWALAVPMLFVACDDDDNPGGGGDDDQNFRAESGVYVFNQGNQSAGIGGALSFIDPSTASYRNDVFLLVNGRELGSMLQDGVVLGDNLYIAVNGSNTVEVVNKNTVQSVAQIPTPSDLGGPRDVVTGEIREQMRRDGTDHVWLDMRPVGKTVLEEHFPTICAHCREKGFDVLKEPVPVVPAQHYFMGGVKVDLNGKTSMKRLFAAGETACNGVHGRNRLASNSLLESLIWAKRAAKAMAAVRGLGIGRFPVSDKRMYQNYAALKQAYADAVREEAEREECCD